MRPRSDGWTPERLEALQKSRADQELFEEATRDDARAERRAARLAAVEVALTPLNRDIIHAREAFRRRRAAAKRAKRSRKANRP